MRTNAERDRYECSVELSYLLHSATKLKEGDIFHVYY